MAFAPEAAGATTGRAPLAVAADRPGTRAPIRAGWMRSLVRSGFPLTTPVLLLLIVAFVGPLIVMLLYTLGALGRDATLGLGTITSVVTDDFTRGVLINTVRMSLTVTVVAFVVGYPIAWVIAGSTGAKRVLLLALVIAPLLTNPVVRTMGWMVMLSPRGAVNSVLGWLGGPTLDLFGNLTGVTIALVHVFLPFMILPMLNTIESIPRSVRESGMVHGGHPIIVFFRVLFPMSIRGVIAGSTLVFLLSAGSLVTPSLIGAKRVWVLSTLIYQQTVLGRWGGAGALALWLFAVALLAVFISNRVGERVAGARSRGTRGPVRQALQSVSVVLAARLRSLPQLTRFGSIARGIYLALFVAFMLIPLGMVIKAAFDSHGSLHAGFSGVTLDHFKSALGSPRWLESFLLSMRMALLAVTVGFLLAIPASYAIVRGSFRGRNALMSFLLSPLAVPRLVLGVGYLLLFNQLAIRPSFWRLVLTHVVIVLPFIARTMVTALHDIDQRLEEAARTLGARQITVFRRIVLPLTKPGISAAAIFAFLVSFDESTLTLLIAGTRDLPLPVRMFGEVYNQWTPEVAAISTMLIAWSLIVLVALAKFVGLSEYAKN